MPWRKPQTLDSESLTRPWLRDAHLRRLDIYLLPRLQERRWTLSELTTYYEEKGQQDCFGPTIIGRWLTTADDRGLVRRYADSPSGREQVWEVTERGDKRDFNLVLKVSLIAGGASAITGLLLKGASGSAKPIAQIALYGGVMLIIGFTIGARAGDRSPRIRRLVVARESEVQELETRHTGESG